MGLLENIQTVLADMQAQKASLAGPLAGLIDILRLELEPEQRTEFNAAREAFESLFNSLIGVEIAARALLARGYPNRPDVPAMPEALAGVRNRVDNMEAAIGLLHAERAISLGLKAGLALPK